VKAKVMDDLLAELFVGLDGGIQSRVNSRQCILKDRLSYLPLYCGFRRGCRMGSLSQQCLCCNRTLAIRLTQS
jgi:hypothetical protein